jgi:hypothetical protein
MLGFMCQLVRIAALATALGVGSVSAAFAQSASPVGLDPAVVTLIADNYRACVAIELAHVDANANGKLDGTEDAEFFADGEAFCQEELLAEMAHAARMAQLDTDIAAANAQVRATTAEIINGAKRQIGLEP